MYPVYFFKCIKNRNTHKSIIEKYLKVFFKKVVAEHCIFIHLNLASDQSWAISFPVKKSSSFLKTLNTKVRLFFLYLPNQTRYISAQKSKWKPWKCAFYTRAYMTPFFHDHIQYFDATLKTFSYLMSWWCHKMTS